MIHPSCLDMFSNWFFEAAIVTHRYPPKTIEEQFTAVLEGLCFSIFLRDDCTPQGQVSVFFPPRILDKPSIPLIHEMKSWDGSSQATIFSAHCESTRLGACSPRDMGVQLAKNGVLRRKQLKITQITQDVVLRLSFIGYVLHSSSRLLNFLNAPRFRNFPKRIPCCTTLVYAFPNLWPNPADAAHSPPWWVLNTIDLD